ncbi:MAG: DUF350 domain-containing protein [Planctomycetota bacterium]
MPDKVITQFWELLPALAWFALAAILFLLSVWIMEKVTPFSIRKEIEEDQNVALGLIIGGAMIAIAIVLGAVIT